MHPQYLGELIEELEENYRWFQLKRHTVKGQRMYTVVIQDQANPRSFHNGQDESLYKAIQLALAKAKSVIV